ncbi:MAG: GTPase HflX [Oscillospiraceae bacterium]|nr:GTPase HflX [Oscillospiraceae bacterium]
MEEQTLAPAPESRAILAGLDTGEYDAETSLAELGELAVTAGAEVICEVLQKRPAPDSATCLGRGRLEEIRDLAEANDVDLLVFDTELSGTQIRNIEQITGVRTIDRTTLILDIFALRATSTEGRLQVLLAQLKYRLPRLTGQGIALSRLGGGIGTRGPGETKLESDRRHIRRQISAIEERLREVAKRRQGIRERRKKNEAETVALMGYTNVGKSTLLNALTGAGVLAEDMLFATLDPTARKLRLPDGRTVILTDTVGLIRRLPHQLVEAFRSTLEEAVYADLILNLCDASDPDAELQRTLTRQLLEELGRGDRPVLTVYNKCDLAPDFHPPADVEGVCISARTGEGIDQLLTAIASELSGKFLRIRLLLPFDKLGLAAELRENGKLFAEEYRETGLYLDVLAERAKLYKYEEYLYDDSNHL